MQNIESHLVMLTPAVVDVRWFVEYLSNGIEMDVDPAIEFRMLVERLLRRPQSCGPEGRLSPDAPMTWIPVGQVMVVWRETRGWVREVENSVVRAATMSNILSEKHALQSRCCRLSVASNETPVRIELGENRR